MNNAFPFRRLMGWLALTLCGLSLVGCGVSKFPEPVEVTGTVTRGGRPVESLLVFFESLSNGKASVGRTDVNGKFSLATGADKKGAIPGEYVVYFQFVAKTPADEMAYQQGTLPLPEDVKVATTNYANGATSKLRVTVKAQGPQEIPLQLD